MLPSVFLDDISERAARAAYSGTSMSPETRAAQVRAEYAGTLAGDYADLRAQAEMGRTLDRLDAEFATYRAGYRRRYGAYLASASRCVSTFIAGPSKFPAARMNKRADMSHRRMVEVIEFRARALAAIKRTLRPDLAPIYASDGAATVRLDAKITHAEAVQARMRATNATIRLHKKAGADAQVAALLAMGYREGSARRLLMPDFCGRIGFADFELTNNSANIRRMKARVEQITRLQATPAREIEGDAARLEDAPQDNRVRLYFHGKPADDVRANLKRSGFRWTPSLGCWQAYRNPSSLTAAQMIVGPAIPLEI